MKKLLFVSLFLVACGKSQNVAEMRVKSDIPNAKCASGTLSDGTSVSKCTIKSEDGKDSVTLIGAVGGDFPFQSWAYRTTTEFKELAKAQASANAAGSGAQLTTTPGTLDAGTLDTGSAAGSGSASK